MSVAIFSTAWRHERKAFKMGTNIIPRTELVEQAVQRLLCGQSVILQGAPLYGKTTLGQMVREDLVSRGFFVAWQNLSNAGSISQNAARTIHEHCFHKNKTVVVLDDDNHGSFNLSWFQTFITSITQESEIISFLICTRNWQNLNNRFDDLPESLTLPEFFLLQIPPFTKQQVSELLLQGLNTLTPEAALRIAIEFNGHPFLISTACELLREMEKKGSPCTNLEPVSIIAALFREEQFETEMLHFIETLTPLKRDCEGLLSSISKHAVVQLPVSGKDMLFLHALAKIARSRQIEVFSQIDLTNSKTLTNNLFEDILGTEKVEQVRAFLESHYPSSSLMHHLDSGKGISQAEWLYFDDYFGELTTILRSSDHKRLLIIDAQEFGPWVQDRIPANWSTGMELAEIVAVALAQKEDKNLQVVLISDQTNLADNLPLYLIREQKERFPFFQCNIQKDYLCDRNDLKAYAFNGACGGDNSLVCQLHEHYEKIIRNGDNLADELYETAKSRQDHQRIRTIHIENPLAWALMLRRLRIADFLQTDPITDLGMPAELFASSMQDLVDEAEKCHSRKLVEDMKGKVSIGKVGWTRRFTSAFQLRDRLMELFQPERSKRGHGRSVKGFLTSWIVDEKEYEAVAGKSFHYDYFADHDIEGDRTFEGNHALKKITSQGQRVAALTAPTRDVFRSWLKIAVRLDKRAILESWAESVGIDRKPDIFETAAYLFASEPASPEEYSERWFGKWPAIPASSLRGTFKEASTILGSEPTSQQKQLLEDLFGTRGERGPVRPEADSESLPDVMTHVSRKIESLLADHLESFLELHFPEGKGPADRRLKEWLIRERWRHKIFGRVSEYLGTGQILKLFREMGKDIPPTKDAYSLLETLLEDSPCPRLPIIRGCRSDIQERVKWLRRSIEEDLSDDARKGGIIDTYQLLEMACMEIIISYAEALPPFLDRIKVKIEKHYRSKVTDMSWQEAVMRLELGWLISLLSSLAKRAKRGGVWEDGFAAIRNIDNIQWDRITAILKELQRIRPLWTHGGYQKSEENRKLATRAPSLFRDLFEESGFVNLLPPIVEVVAMRRDVWGRHVDLIEEMAEIEQPKMFTAYRVTLHGDPIGKRFYLLSPINPLPVEPLMIPEQNLKRKRMDS